MTRPGQAPVSRSTIEAIAQARATKAARLLGALIATNSRSVIDGAVVRRLDDRAKARFVEATGVKVASPDTWRCVELAADAYCDITRAMNRAARLRASSKEETHDG